MISEITQVREGKEIVGYLYATDKLNYFVFKFVSGIGKTNRIKKIKEIQELEKRTGLVIEIK